MDKEKHFKITGDNQRLDFSPYGKYLLIGGCDEGFKIFDVAQEKIVCKTKLKGPKNEINICNTGMSFDGKYATFSCLSKVFVMDIDQKETVWEYGYSCAERSYSGKFCFFHHSHCLAIPDGDCLLVHNMENGKSCRIPLPDGAGWTDCLAISPDDRHIAYKSGNGVWDIRLDRDGNITKSSEEPGGDLSDKIYVYELGSGGLLPNSACSLSPGLRDADFTLRMHELCG